MERDRRVNVVRINVKFLTLQLPGSLVVRASVGKCQKGEERKENHLAATNVNTNEACM